MAAAAAAALLLLGAAAAAAAAADPPSSSSSSCPCANASWCQPLGPTPTATPNSTSSSSSSLRLREIFGFRGGGSLNAETKWQHYDWGRVTTVAWADPGIPELTCRAHEAGARVVLAAPDPLPLNDSGPASTAATLRALWVDRAVALVQASFADGLVFDWELPVDPRTDQGVTCNYVDLINATTQALHAAVPGSQVSVCLAWSPTGVDGRWYPNKELIEAADVAYVMMYDTRSQIFDQCVASANAGYPAARLGLEQYLALGADPQKLVLGVPWYAYDYPCLPPMDPQSPTCNLALTPFRGVDCSDAAGAQVAYEFVAARLAAANGTATGRRWDDYLKSPWFNYVDEKDGTVHQVWFDDAESLTWKYRLARELGLRGVGPYTFDDLDYTGMETGRGEAAVAEAKAMWEAFDAFLLDASPPPPASQSQSQPRPRPRRPRPRFRPAAV